jgi:catechol 2,3-dioxygenase-like lactoylglutathione lyase family enzyme
MLHGVNHVAILTNDTDRLHAFYRDNFGATTSQDMKPEPGARLSFIELGGGAQLNVFQIEGNTEADRQVPMFGRGRIDHLALQAESRDAFDEIRRRLMACGATDGFVTDFGPIYSLFFRDPDGLECEVCVEVAGAAGVNPPGTPAPGYEIGK